MNKSNQDHYSETFITDDDATSNILNSEENITNLKDAETLVFIGDSITITEGWGWQLAQLSET